MSSLSQIDYIFPIGYIPAHYLHLLNPLKAVYTSERFVAQHFFCSLFFVFKVLSDIVFYVLIETMCLSLMMICKL